MNVSNFALQNIHELARENSADEDTFYNISTSTNNIQDFVKHLMRDAQQKKAKVAAFEEINEETGFWLKDFCQQVLPQKFREGQKEYFGKKGMSLHVDVFFVNRNNALKKHVYMTAIYRCDQGTSSVISLADKVLNQFCTDEPGIRTLYAKSDNAGCYHGNYSAESIYHLYKEKNIQL